MLCPICRADIADGSKVCPSCGSNTATRGGADIILRDDGSLDHAGSSRWKAGLGTAGGAGILAVAKFKALAFLLLKVYWIFGLVRLATFGGTVGLIVGVSLIAVIVLGSLFHFRRRLPI